MFKNLLALISGVILLILGFMFSLVVLAIIAVIGLTIWGHLWWRTRKLHRDMREQVPTGQTVDGEAIVIEQYTVGAEDTLPGEIPGK